MGESVLGVPVGVAAELSEVRQPRVGAFDGPSHPEWGGGFVLGGAAWSSAGADDVVDAPVGGAGPDGAAVIAAVEVQGLDVGEQAAVGCRVEGGGEQNLVVAVGAVGAPTHRDAGAVTQQGPLPTGFPALRILAGSDGVEEGPVGFPGVEQRPVPVVGESSEPEGGAFDALIVLGCPLAGAGLTLFFAGCVPCKRSVGLHPPTARTSRSGDVT